MRGLEHSIRGKRWTLFAFRKSSPVEGAYRPGIYRGWGCSGDAAVPAAIKRDQAKIGSQEKNKIPEVENLGYAPLAITAGVFSMAFPAIESLDVYTRLSGYGNYRDSSRRCTWPADRALSCSGDIRTCWLRGVDKLDVSGPQIVPRALRRASSVP